VISLDAGHRLFGTKTDEKTYYSSVAIEAADFMEADKKEEILKKLFPKPVDPDGLSASESSIFDPVVLGWKELNPSVIEMTAMAAMKMDFYLVFLIITISFGILNTVQMSIQERMREFGILIAIGTGIGRLTLMILYEVIILIVPPVLTGLIFASAFAMYFNTYPLDFSGTVLGKMYISMGLNPILRPIIDFYDLLKIALWMILPSLAVGLFAAGRIRKLNPVQVIQTL
jgi:ABC-type antimicrobial peptide transport system permease subunit